ncbi:YoaK family protein [Herbiconiux daphne]|uniref:DUF1275 domain-containing protein n=1 Tax=Herbiconiux daphne TaxID=2970914 RepID=A0ABT2H840_9MICO|nr:YoaK family protein [Herbiconiux daphne]MCS5736126.1 DUF1275 domain-containing protein [Herbiconiux daphne]
MSTSSRPGAEGASPDGPGGPGGPDVSAAPDAPDGSGAPDAPGLRSRLAAVALVLSFAAGATDAFAFLLLGGVFTANMTGNLVLAGLTQRPNYPSMIVGVVIAIIAFVIGLYVALKIARPRPSPARLVIVLALGLAAQVAVLIGWILAPDRSNMLDQAPLIALSGFAMAVQTGVSKRIESRSGVSTTYVTGTITSLVSDFADKKPQAGFTRIGVVVALVIGALCGSLAMTVSTTLGAALPVVPAALGLVLVLLLVRRWPAV